MTNKERMLHMVLDDKKLQELYEYDRSEYEDLYTAMNSENVVVGAVARIIKNLDGSTDESGKICDEWCSIDQRFRVVHKKNGGVANARNQGLELAKGEFIAFCDSDDYYEPNFLEILIDIQNKFKSDFCSLFENINNISADKLLHFFKSKIISCPIIHVLPMVYLPL